MGLSCSTCCKAEDDNVYENDSNDKTNLLGNPVGENSRSTSQNNSLKQPDKNTDDQQAKLNQILQKTANSYIDVPALNSPVDQSMDKSKDYESKFKVTLNKQQSPTQQRPVLKDTPNAERLLSDEPICEGDQKMMTEACTQILAATKNIKIENTESLIIPFDVQKDK